LSSLKTDFKDAVLASGTLRKYQQISNPDGTVSFQDASQYSQVGDKAQASVFNATNAEVNAHEGNAAVHITQLSCTKTGTVYALTGLTATSGIVPCVFQAPATYVAGDTFTVNGVAYSVVTSGGEALRPGAFISGDVVEIHLDVTAQKLYIRQENPNQVGAIPMILGAVTDCHATTAPGNYAIGGPTLNAPYSPIWGMVESRTSDGKTYNGISGLHALRLTDSNGVVFEQSAINGGAYTPWHKPIASTADNASGAVPLTSPGVRNQTTTTAGASGGADGDSWDQV
jgi:hypothetical protein